MLYITKHICFVSPDREHAHVAKWKDEFEKRGYHITIVNPEGNLYKKIRETQKQIKQLDPDIIHAHYAFLYGFLAATAKRKKPFVLSFWGSDARTDPQIWWKRPFIKYAIKKADLIHVQDPLMKKRVEEIYQHKNIVVAQWGVNLDRFKPSTKKKGKKKKILCTRNTKELYHIDTVLNAMPLVLKEKDVEFIFTNPGFEKIDGVDAEKYTITGKLDEKNYVKLLQECDMYIDSFYPDDGRGGQAYGQALLEAMACKMPTVIADRPTLHIEMKWYHGKTFEPGNEKDLAEKIIYTLDNESETKREVDMNYQSVKRNFNWKEQMDRIEKRIYKRNEK